LQTKLGCIPYFRPKNNYKSTTSITLSELVGRKREEKWWWWLMSKESQLFIPSLTLSSIHTLRILRHLLNSLFSFSSFSFLFIFPHNNLSMPINAQAPSHTLLSLNHNRLVSLSFQNSISIMFRLVFFLGIIFCDTERVKFIDSNSD
jgi:hypothetical protein